jgi:hypothetical protein
MQQTLGSFGALGQLAQTGDLDLTNVKTERPVIAGNELVTFKVIGSTVEPGKTDPQKLNWVLETETVREHKSTKSDVIPPGFKVKHYTGLVASAKRTSDMVLADVCRKLDAIYGEETRKTIKLDTFDLSAVVGAEFSARASVEPEKADPETGEIKPEQNRFREIKKGDQ